MPQPKTKQIPLSESDRTRLITRIESDYNTDSHDLSGRVAAMRRWYRLWRNVNEGGAFPEEERSNFSIPLILWTIKAKLAKEVDVLLGEESEISVNPIGPADVDRVEKVRRWMNWRVKMSLKLFKKLYVHLLQKNIFGTSIMFVPWVTKTRKCKRIVTVNVEQPPIEAFHPLAGMVQIQQPPIPTPQEQEYEMVDFDGPDPQVENLEDWIVPSNIVDFMEEHFIRRLWLSVDQLLDLRDQGKLDADVVAKELDRLRRMADSGSSTKTDVVSQEKADQTGVPTNPTGRVGKLVVYNWFGKFRVGLNPDGTGGEERAEDVVAFLQPETHLLLGVCRLIDIFPDGRLPFVVSRSVMDVNNTWGIGAAEMLEPISREMDAFQNLAISSGEGGIGPVILFEPGSGFDPEKHRLEPFTAIPTANAAGIKVVNMGNINLAPYVTLMQQLLGYAENVTSVNNAQLGRQFDQPNAPRTYGQQALLQGESNVNLLLDMRLERENLRELLKMIWDMDKRWLAKPVFFRVTESDPYDTMTDEDMQGEYDFDIGPITAISNRAQKMQETMQALALSQPMGIPQVTMALFKKILQKLGQADVAALLPDLEKMKPPMSPEDENIRLLQGENPQVHPMDNHMQHIAIHEDLKRRIQETPLDNDPESEHTMEAANPQAVGRIDGHIAMHQQFMKQGITAAIAAAMGGGAPQIGMPQGGGMAQPQLPNPFADAQSSNSAAVNSGPLNLG